MDTFSKEKRREIMQKVLSKNNKAEVLIRKSMHHLGIRYRLHDIRLPGCPDIVIPKYKTVVFVNGCLWHGHDCKRGRIPKTNTEYWNKKIKRNKNRDYENIMDLFIMNWRIIILWECSFRGLGRDKITLLASECYRFLKSNENYLELDLSFKSFISKR
ncbi:DNA mismatch endonuclease Vsr [Salmonella enterica subsp. salamae]|uniref:very short patch repair endonuclease n=1 Tax=Salmonella enterica TaxID=28901 RepID=UPI0003BBA502|nr:DNA mismatch endonuclease Vsr [Salmonella enterica]EAA6221729.1 DNA mismatch endonuclease Vsr [Salmonella enterica subsp. salamae]EBZ2011926.1 DNA mismatch endonuclease Vsr [Salmonella enterica subsp. enterica serovar Newport]ECF6083280.1 DNA mismatch endonuclease Vsr [Salmonella enterica subsp. houtenae]EBL7633402.1 DNA mismatch endonuclease Vsr [Salmonella enterica]ECC9759757.1 DNA mismatch endonuclease Vsr [Salmonella enterica subsp. salamae]